MKRATLTILTVLIFILANRDVSANDIQVSNAKLTGYNKTDDYTMVQFDLSWQNSWRSSAASGNFDAAWVFVKYRVSGGEWQHAWLNNDGHTTGSGTGAMMTPGLLTPASVFNATTNPALGVFICRSADGSGTFSITGARLRWNYGDNGIADDDVVEVKVFAVEMVWVPEGSFYVGSGGTETGSFTNGSWTSGATIPLQITSENALTIGQAAGNLWGTSSSGNSTIGSAGTLPAAYPKGYSAFFCMKYEISEQQYVDFLNTLTTVQASKRYSVSSTGYRYGISVSGGVYSTTKPYIACGWMNWGDGAAYSDWAGLRPMTEMEYEKACRGPLTPVADEFAWGSTSVTAANNITNDGAANETTNTTGANAAYGNQTNVSGPLRVGVFATGATTRAQSGAGYWGIMELSGNLSERAVTVGNSEGRSYTGSHGDGVLTTTASYEGNATNTDWPGIDATTARGVTGALGSGFRGGSWAIIATTMRASNRLSGAESYADRLNVYGFRSVRSVPFACGLSSMTVNHTTTDGVAPVDKTVTYGTVTNIPGETSKCWITSNLGADHQATAVNDATEASAGWYWQFNRKQGFKHDGSVKTPDGVWTNTINENIDWETAKDPCTLELGSGWRLPTQSEWTNTDESGNWSNWNGPWGSGLKLHAAGRINYNDGLLAYRGAGGYYWSNTNITFYSAALIFYNTGSSVNTTFNKAMTCTLRCLRDPLPIITTAAVSSVTGESATCGGNVTSEGNAAVTARGVCWSTSPNPTTALTTKTTDGTGSGSFTSSITGLTAGTTYYVRAYATSSSGTTYGNEISFIAQVPFVCGTSSLTISHTTAGGVAPVAKTVTYGTVTNIPGETSKCWITKNLGADIQADSVNAKLETKAGWYWQFNRKQGYKHNGTNRTPNTTWITSISENSDWLTANDPCALELGTGWRLPTKTEWENVNNSGSWSTWSGPWNSGLKLHAAGYLSATDGSLKFRGGAEGAGKYWSTKQDNSIAFGWFLTFNSTTCYPYVQDKSYGYSVRCIKN